MRRRTRFSSRPKWRGWKHSFRKPASSRASAPRSCRYAWRSPGCARPCRRRRPGPRGWKGSLPSFARPGRCCRRRSMAARASSRRSHAPGASAASSPALSAMAAPGGPGSRNAPKSTTRPPMRACVRVARSPTWRTASVPRPSSRSKSSPTHAGSSVPGGGAVASAHRRLWKCRRPRWRGCSPTRPTGSASGRASCSSTVPACAPCTALARGCAPRGFRSRRGRWPTP